MDFLDYYRDNLYYIRALAAEFAAEFPKIAGRLSLSEFDCQDPYIERLLEGTAFLAAKTEKKLDDGYYGLLESILNSISPSATYPLPSGGVMELLLKPDSEMLESLAVKEGTLLSTAIPSINTPCRFSVSDTIPLNFCRVLSAQYLLRNLSNFKIKEPDALSALHLELSSPIPGLPLSTGNSIRFFFNAAEADVSLLFRLLRHDILSVYTRAGGDDGAFQKLEAVEFDLPMSFGGKIFEQTSRSNTRGLRLLQHYLAYPDFFKFFTLRNAGTMGGTQVELVVFFKRQETQLLNSITPNSIKTNCVPVLNIFPKRSDRTAFDRKAYEVHVVPDRTAMGDYEVVNIKQIDFFDERNDHIFSAVNFYDENLAEDREVRNFFSVKRRGTLVDKNRTRRSSYRGTEVFVSFAPDEERLENAYQMMADLVVTNRDLPLLLLPEAEFITGLSFISGGAFVSPPSRPGLPLISRGSRADYARLSHIVLNLSAMLWQEGGRPLEMFREMLRAYQIRSPEENNKMIAGFTKLESEWASFTFIKNGMVFFEWGWKVRFTLDEIAFTGMGCYMFGCVIAEILKSFAAVNTLLEIEFFTEQSGHIATWKTFEG